jgi:drug/metabolite transporter (DMT)-like permease
MSPPATFLLSVFFGLLGGFYLIAVVYAAYSVARDNPDRIEVAIPALIIGLAVAVSFLYGAFLLRHEKRSGLKWIVFPLLVIAAQWLVDLSPPPGQFLTFFLSLIGVIVAWLELTRDDAHHERIDIRR